MVKMKIINYQLEAIQSAGSFVDERPAHGVCGKPSDYDGLERNVRGYSRKMAPNSPGRNNDRRTGILSSIDSCVPLEVKVI